MAHEIQWQYFPKSSPPPELVEGVIEVFASQFSSINSPGHSLRSNEVLGIVTAKLQALGFEVETGKRASEKIRVPVLFGRNGRVEKSFEADAWHRSGKFVLEVEAGRGITNNQFLKDLFQACMMHDVEYLAIAVRTEYRGAKNFETMTQFFETLYASNRLDLPLRGLLAIGY